MSLSIDNVTKTNHNTYSVAFSATFSLVDLFYEVSADGNTWSAPIAISTSTPQSITVENMINFQIRLSSNFTTPSSERIHSSAFTETFN